MKAILAVVVILIVINACTRQKNKAEIITVSIETQAKAYCGSCHLYPEPKLLDTAGWQKAFAWMGPFMGVYANENQRKELLGKGDEREELIKSNVFPQLPIIDSDQFEEIKQWYLRQSAAQYAVDPFVVLDTIDLFEPIIPSWKLVTPSITVVKISDQSIWAADANSRTINELDFHGNLKNQTILPDEATVDLLIQEKSTMVLNMGSFSPTNLALGNFVLLSEKGQHGVLVKGLKRPVDFELADFFNRGQKNDIVFCEFGKWTGSLSLYSAENGVLKKKLDLDKRPGALKCHIDDFNNDGLDDVMALFGQGAESIDVYYNQGDGTFSAKRLLSFPPTYGSVYFELIDFDNDGDNDILYVNGDNADVGQVIKSYHGIRFFENDGNFNFSQHTFLRMDGAYKAISKDFDKDGDNDLLAISFFPRFNESQIQSILYFENNGHMQFKPFVVKGSDLGRWMVMDAKDFDQDGDEDVVLGSLMFEIKDDTIWLNHWLKNQVPMLVLKNKMSQ